jgi:hypothetical protein
MARLAFCRWQQRRCIDAELYRAVTALRRSKRTKPSPRQLSHDEAKRRLLARSAAP